jgi:pilus assembly protein Flp/PilA
MKSKVRVLHAALVTGRDERGATAVEYAILASMIAAVVAGTVGVLGVGVNDLFASFELP